MKGWGSVLAWNAGLLLGLAVIVELVFGGWLEAMDKPELWRLSIYRNVSWQLSADGKYHRPDPVVYRRDAFGLRGRYGRPDGIDVLVLGGSTTDERFVSEAETWTEVMAGCLRDRGLPTRVANAGIAGQSSRGHIRNFDLWFPHVPGLRPKAILVYLGINERVIEGREAEDDVRNYNESGRPAWLERIKLKSALFALATTVRGNLLAWRAGLHTSRTANGQDGATATDALWQSQAGRRVEAGSPEERDGVARARTARTADLSAYEQRLWSLVDKIRTTGATPILVTQSAGTYRRDGRVIIGNLDDYFDMTAFNAVTMAVCNKAGAECIDLGGTVEFKDGDFWDSVHTTPAGSNKVGRLICQALADRPLVLAE